MNVIITVATYYPKRDGVQNVTSYLAEGLVKKGHNVIVVTGNYNNKEYEVYNGVKIIRVNLYTKYGVYFGDKKKYKKIILEECKKNDLLINVCAQNAFTDLLLNDLKKIKINKILYLHGIYDFKFHKYDFKNLKFIINKIWKNIRWRIFYRLNTKNFKLYNNIINIHNLVSGTKYFENNIKKPIIIENAADDSFFEGNVSKKDRIICVSNYTDAKNQKFVLKAFYTSSSAKKYEMLFIGISRNKYYDELIKENENLEKKYGKRKIKFLYGLSREQTINYIKESKIYLFGSKHEMFPVSIIEAMASKVPFISTNVGCVRSLPGGFIVNNENEMSHMLDELINDSKLLDNLSITGFEYACNRFRITDKIELLNDIITKGIDN